MFLFLTHLFLRGIQRSNPKTDPFMSKRNPNALAYTSKRQQPVSSIEVSDNVRLARFFRTLGETNDTPLPLIRRQMRNELQRQPLSAFLDMADARRSLALLFSRKSKRKRSFYYEICAELFNNDGHKFQELASILKLEKLSRIAGARLQGVIKNFEQRAQELAEKPTEVRV